MGPMLCHQKICLDTIWKKDLLSSSPPTYQGCSWSSLKAAKCRHWFSLLCTWSRNLVFQWMDSPSFILCICPPGCFQFRRQTSPWNAMERMMLASTKEITVTHLSDIHPMGGWLWSVSRCRKCLLETFSTHWKLWKAISATENFERLTSNNFNRNWCGRTFWLKEEKTPFSPWSNLLKKWKLPLCERRGQRSVNEIYFSSSSPSAKALNGSFLSIANQITLFNWSWLTVVTGFCAHLYRKNWQNLKKWHMLPTDLF